jgi:fucose 4-O-acetylase-like acetyltransferase
VKERDLDLDFVKGALVVLMTVYHAMNHFADVPAEYYGYLRFVNGSFVFVSGYVAAVFYRHVATARAGSTSRRLLERGLKLLAVFTALNLLASLAGATNYRNVNFGLSAYLGNAADIYGSGDSKQVAFRILVPIAYVLMLAGLVLQAGRWRSWLLAALVMLSAVYSVLGPTPPNLLFVIVGLFGIAIGSHGSAPGARVRSIAVIAIGLAALSGCMNFLSGNAVSYSLGIALMLKLMLDGTAMARKTSRAFQAGVLLGRYSLLCYILQIGFLYAADGVTRHREPTTWQALPITVIVTLALLLAVSVALDGLRRHYQVVDRTYRLVFA